MYRGMYVAPAGESCRLHERVGMIRSGDTCRVGS
jgi:hypothetical protein